MKQKKILFFGAVLLLSLKSFAIENPRTHLSFKEADAVLKNWQEWNKYLSDLSNCHFSHRLSDDGTEFTAEIIVLDHHESDKPNKISINLKNTGFDRIDSYWDTILVSADKSFYITYDKMNNVLLRVTSYDKNSSNIIVNCQNERQDHYAVGSDSIIIEMTARHGDTVGVEKKPIQALYELAGRLLSERRINQFSEVLDSLEGGGIYCMQAPHSITGKMRLRHLDAIENEILTAIKINKKLTKFKIIRDVDCCKANLDLCITNMIFKP